MHLNLVQSDNTDNHFNIYSQDMITGHLFTNIVSKFIVSQNYKVNVSQRAFFIDIKKKKRQTNFFYLNVDSRKYKKGFEMWKLTAAQVKKGWPKQRKIKKIIWPSSLKLLCQKCRDKVENLENSFKILTAK